MPEELPESDRRADRGLLARARRRTKGPAGQDGAGSDTADAETPETDAPETGAAGEAHEASSGTGTPRENGSGASDDTGDGRSKPGTAATDHVKRLVLWGRRMWDQRQRISGTTGTGTTGATTGGAQPGGLAATGRSAAPGAASTTTVADGTAAATTTAADGPASTAAADQTIATLAEGTAAIPEQDGGLARRRSRDGEADPITDMKARQREAGVDERFPFGRPGRPLTRNHPFVFGFYGALGVLAAYILVQALTNARSVIILIVVALFLAVGLNPGVEALERIGVARRWSVLLVFLALVGFFVAFGFAIVPPLSEQTTAIIHNLTSGHGYLEQLQNNPKLRDLDQRYHLLDKARTALESKDLGTRAANGVVGVGQVVVSGVFSTLTVLILTLYFLTSLPNITGFMYRLAPRSRRARVALLGDEILARIGGYVAGNLLISLIAGVTTYIFLLIVGVPYALALALLVAITDLIPLVGATIGAVFVTAISFFSGLWVGIATAIFFVIYQQVENYVVQPRVMKRSVDVQPAVTIIAALIGGALLGVIGALLAIPAAAAVALILREVVMPRQEES
ncbi:AI-2E family transporter [Actinoallomurus sp. NBC_01490]|uniref:AI-2E family transporter n=1 Tax=Actinoallomurus sp. NBC_01490 TaxID=2903557 RepID=UPI002E30BA53|nr:AI-2E family transporter [Actinoallomurus sp. NBC_01490]